MSQAAAITLNDGQATPVAVTFNPESVTPALSTFADRTSGIALGFRRLRFRNTFAKGNSSVNRAVFEVEYPVVATVNGVATLSYTLRGKVECILPDGTTDAERKNLFAFLKNGLANAAITGQLRDLDPMY